jgi:hypothetical protein
MPTGPVSVPSAECPPIRISNHAATRYLERVRDVSEQQARRELIRLIDSAEVTPDPPPWLRNAEVADAWARLGPDVALPLVAQDGILLAATTIVRNWMPPEPRARRNSERAKFAAGRRARKIATRGPRPSTPPDAREWPLTEKDLPTRASGAPW